MNLTAFKRVSSSVLLAALAACGGGGGDADPTDTPPSTSLTVTGTAATGLAIAGATVTGKCKVGTGTATTLANGTFTLVVTDGQLPCVLQVTNPADGTKLHTVVVGTGNTAIANITPLTEMTTARALDSEPNVFFAAFDAVVASQKLTTSSVATAQTEIDLVLAGTIDSTSIGDFITTPLVAATQGSPASGDAQDRLLDALKLKFTTAQLGTVTTALASNYTVFFIKQTVISLTTAPTAPPVANAGSAQSIVTGTTVTLDASTSSAATGKTLTYAWTLTTKPTGSAATLAAATTVRPTFVADVAGAYVATVTVNDGTSDSSAAAVTITASVANAAPVANAGVAQNIVAGSLVTLDGSASSDANSDPLTYAWTLTSKPTGSAAVLSSSTSAKPTFTVDIAGTYVASLTVNDGKGNSTASAVTVTAAVANAAPVANAGAAQTLIAGALVTLDGSASSDANGDALTYAWTLTARPTGSAAVLSSTATSRSSFTADVAGTYVATLVVNDGKVSSASVNTPVTATGINFDALVTSLKGFANGKSFATDTTQVIVGTSATQLTVRLEQFFDGTCIYTANLTANRDGVQQGSYQCSDFSTGTWDLLSMQRVESSDIFVKLRKDGVSIKRAYGMSSALAATARTLPVSIASLAGTFKGIATGPTFGTESTTTTVVVSGSTLNLEIGRFFAGTCRYTATIQPSGLSVTGGTYTCADFTSGTWTLLDMRIVGGDDLYVALQLESRIQRVYGIK